MAYNTYYGPNTLVTERCIWLAEGCRCICISYEYTPFTGILKYAATIFRSEIFSDTSNGHVEFVPPSQKQMLDNAHTTERRFSIRPVIVSVEQNLDYDDIIKRIRHEMCHGCGCKGYRIKNPDPLCDSDDNESTSSGNSFISHLDEDSDYDYEDDVDVESLEHKKVRKVRYISTTQTETYKGKKTQIIREYFIAFKANKHNGDLIYGAAISRRREEEGPITDKDLISNHYKTAIARLDRKPVPMRISDEFRHQLKKSVTHREDVMYEILDVINSRPGGRFLIRGDW